jgi:hypothetical protein
MIRPLVAENRVFDPAVLDTLSRAAGADSVASRVDAFLRGHATRLSGLRSLADTADAARVAASAQALAEEAASLGLMRAARAAFNVGEAAEPRHLASLERELRHGADELRSWRPVLPG